MQREPQPDVSDAATYSSLAHSQCSAFDRSSYQPRPIISSITPYPPPSQPMLQSEPDQIWRRPPQPAQCHYFYSSYMTSPAASPEPGEAAPDTLLLQGGPEASSQVVGSKFTGHHDHGPYIFSPGLGIRSKPQSDVLPLPGHAETSSQADVFDLTGQEAPPGKTSGVKTTIWDDKGCLLFHVEARGISVARRTGNANQYVAIQPQPHRDVLT